VLVFSATTSDSHYLSPPNAFFPRTNEQFAKSTGALALLVTMSVVPLKV
jgi:hypothetical protein